MPRALCGNIFRVASGWSSQAAFHLSGPMLSHVTLVTMIGWERGSTIRRMEQTPSRLLLWLVAVIYAGVVLLSAVLIYIRYLAYVNHPDDVMASSGMWAGGDLILEFFIAGMLLVPTLLLVLVIRKFERAYTKYSQTLLAISLTAPISVGLFLIPAVNQSNSMLGYACMYRLFAAPMVVVGLAMSRIFARFRRAKRFSSYALLVEAGTFGAMVALLVH